MLHTAIIATIIRPIIYIQALKTTQTPLGGETVVDSQFLVQSQQPLLSMERSEERKRLKRASQHSPTTPQMLCYMYFFV